MINRFSFDGRLGRSPDFKPTADNAGMATFSVAIDTWDGKAKAPGEPLWVDVVCFGKVANTAMHYLQKGSRVYIEGRLALRQFTTREGKPGQSLSVTASTLLLMGAFPEKLLKEAGSVGADPDPRATPDKVPAWDAEEPPLRAPPESDLPF